MFLVDIDISWLDIDILRPDIDILWLDIKILISSLKILFSISEYFGDKLGQFYPPFEGVQELSRLDNVHCKGSRDKLLRSGTDWTARTVERKEQ